MTMSNYDKQTAAERHSLYDPLIWDEAKKRSFYANGETYEIRLQRLSLESAERVEAARRASANRPFDYRSEISADARHISGQIVKHLWIIFVLMPVALGILFELLTMK